MKHGRKRVLLMALTVGGHSFDVAWHQKEGSRQDCRTSISYRHRKNQNKAAMKNLSHA